MAPSAREVPTTHSPTTGPDDLCRVDRLPRHRHTGRTCVLAVSACLVLLALLLEPRTSAVVAEVLPLLGVVCGLLVIRGAGRTWHKPSATSRWVTRSLGARRQLLGTVG